MLGFDIDSQIIEFTSTNLVKIRKNSDQSSKVTTISFDQFCEAVLTAKDNNPTDIQEIVDTPILPFNKHVRTVQHRKINGEEDLVIMLRDGVSSDITYFDTLFPNVGMPKMLFAFKVRNKTITSSSVVAVIDEIITEDTIIYSYPFSNAGGQTGSICYGNNSINKILIEELSMLHGIPAMFLSMPNNNDNYGHNSSTLQYRPLLEELSNKPFPNEWLKSSRTTYAVWKKGLK